MTLNCMRKSSSYFTIEIILMMYILDWITCCCYMALSKLRYIDWDPESSAIVNSGVIVGCFVMAGVNLVLLYFSPHMLQTFYGYGNFFSVFIFGLAQSALFLRYYYFRKDAISIMQRIFIQKNWDKLWFLIIMDIFTLFGSFAILFFVVQYVKWRGIVLDF